MAFRHRRRGLFVSLAAVLSVILVTIPLASAKDGSLETSLEAVRGQWLTEGAKALVEIEPCASDESLLCGRIVWTWQPSKTQGALILRDFDWAGGMLWKGGRLFDPRRDRGYRGRVEMTGSDRLEVRGCLFAFCKTQVWLRPSELIEAMPQD